jgi:ABC-type uncharacterized transport system permease subunit
VTTSERTVNLVIGGIILLGAVAIICAAVLISTGRTADGVVALAGGCIGALGSMLAGTISRPPIVDPGKEIRLISPGTAQPQSQAARGRKTGTAEAESVVSESTETETETEGVAVERVATGTNDPKEHKG